MKVIILVAGQGTRLKPLTDDRPKCMVKLLGKPLLEHQLNVLASNNISDIYVVTGYLKEKICYPQLKGTYHNPRYEQTNMVVSLFTAKEIMEGDDLLITYGDIVYSEEVIEKVISDTSKIGVVVDKGWHAYWAARMENPLDDAETLKVNSSNEIIELGKKTDNIDEVQGQYIGMIKIRKDFVAKVVSFYESLDKNGSYDGKSFENMYMTSFLQEIIQNLTPLTPIYIENGWMEIDEPNDLNFTQFLES